MGLPKKPNRTTDEVSYRLVTNEGEKGTAEVCGRCLALQKDSTRQYASKLQIQNYIRS